MDIDMSGFSRASGWPQCGPVPKLSSRLANLLNDDRFNEAVRSLNDEELEAWICIGVEMIRSRSTKNSDKDEA